MNLSNSGLSIDLQSRDIILCKIRFTASYIKVKRTLNVLKPRNEPGSQLCTALLRGDHLELIATESE